MNDDQSKKSEVALREEEILKFWQDNQVFEKSLAKESPKGEYVFYEGPPTANAKPALHHLEARVFKDILPRYKTMRGFHVRRKAGWDTHGLPVELQIEKKLDLKSKKEIEQYGVEAFNKACKDSVFEYIGDWEKFTDRIGYWVDKKSAYYTFDTNYIESVWNVLKTVDEKKLLYKDYKVLPWCPRCGTALSSHELAQGYQEDKDLSVTVEFNVKGRENTSLLAWTTTPWTLPGNVALAVGKDIEYVKIKTKIDKRLEEEYSGEKAREYILAKACLDNIFSPAKFEYEIIEEVKGSDLIGLEYEPLYPYLAEKFGTKDPQAFTKAYKVYSADFVNTTEGTGIVHTAVMYGQDDFELGTKVGLPKFHLVKEDGHFVDGVGFLSGRFVKEVDDKGKPTVAVDIIDDLKKRGLFFSQENIKHQYPHCWRCKTPLIYYARDSWYIAMSTLRQQLLKENEQINWEPAYIKEGRFGEWLREVKDWAISRERYWGTPLPIWIDKNGKYRVVGSLMELKSLAKNPAEVDTLDLHKPFIDQIELVDEHGDKLTRVKEVMDVWFDSGSMPFAQDHYPFENKEYVDTQGYPADFISEAIDQTRGWFYTLHAIGTLMGKGAAYKNVICLGHILDTEGKKMSKSIGNIVDPWAMIDMYGVDALRLWMYSINQPGDSKNFDQETVKEIIKKVFNPLENILSFYELYKNESIAASDASTDVLDRWIIARLNELLQKGSAHLDSYEVFEAARLIRDFVNDFSTWYIRRSRDRFKSDNVQEKNAALKTTRFVLQELSKYLAPFTPFFAEYLYKNVRSEKDVESVHLCNWPQAGEIDYQLIIDMQRTRESVTAVLEARQKAGIKVRQPLAALYIKENISLELRTILGEEVNVKEVGVDETLESPFELDMTITPELQDEGNVRDMIRVLQDTRKEAKLTPSQVVTVSIETDEGGKKFIEENSEAIKKPTNIGEFVFENNNGAEIKIEEMKFKIVVK